MPLLLRYHYAALRSRYLRATLRHADAITLPRCQRRFADAALRHAAASATLILAVATP